MYYVFKFVAVGFAMRNITNEIEWISNFVTLSGENKGVAFVINRLKKLFHNDVITKYKFYY